MASLHSWPGPNSKVYPVLMHRALMDGAGNGQQSRKPKEVPLRRGKLVPLSHFLRLGSRTQEVL